MYSFYCLFTNPSVYSSHLTSIFHRTSNSLSEILWGKLIWFLMPAPLAGIQIFTSSAQVSQRFPICFTTLKNRLTFTLLSSHIFFVPVCLCFSYSLNIILSEFGKCCSVVQCCSFPHLITFLSDFLTNKISVLLRSNNMKL